MVERATDNSSIFIWQRASRLYMEEFQSGLWPGPAAWSVWAHSTFKTSLDFYVMDVEMIDITFGLTM